VQLELLTAGQAPSAAPQVLLAGLASPRGSRSKAAGQVQRAGTPESHAGGALVLIVDDDATVRRYLATALTSLGYSCRMASDADEALANAVSDVAPELVLLDVNLPRQSGLEVLARLKGLNRWIEVVMLSGSQDLETVRFCLRQGAYDYLAKPASFAELSETVSRAIERGRLVRQNHHYQSNLERMVRQRTEELRSARDAALLTLAKLADSRDAATGQHLERIAAYARLLTGALRDGAYGGEVSAEFEEQIFRSSPLHDVGKVAIPDSILLKPGPLTPDEQAVMRTHAAVGGDILRAVVEASSDYSFLKMGMEIAYQHHERWDGGGYPAGLAGPGICLAARIVALVDAYDAMTTARPYKRPLPHGVAVERITVDRGRHFDPVIVDTFLSCQQSFQRVRSAMEAPR
jgi:putative two-component system response regulator